jgi:hypothetical protein
MRRPMKFRVLTIAALALACALPMLAQTASPAGFVASSDVLAVNCAGNWGAGNLTTEAYDLVDFDATKSNRIFVQGIELTAPSCAGGLSVFGGGVIWQPDFSALLAKTNLAAGNFTVQLNASLGNGIPAAGSDRVTALAGAKVQYILTDSVTVNALECGVMFYGATRTPYCSAGIAAYFGGTPASAAVSSNVRKSLLKRVASATAKLAAK